MSTTDSLRRFLLPACAILGACATRGTVHEVSHVFSREESALRFRAPASVTEIPRANAKGSMPESLDAAQRYLARRDGDSGRAAYVRALLACARLARGEVEAAKEACSDVAFPKEHLLIPENRAVCATEFAVTAARTIEARAALEQVFSGTLPAETFVARYGSLAGFDVPDPSAPGYQAIVRRQARLIEMRCLGKAKGHAVEIRRQGRKDLRRTLGEQLYNELASLLAYLPKEGEREVAGDRFLSAAAVSYFIAYAYAIPDVLPRHLSSAQKEWLLEETDGLFQNTKKVAANLLSRAERKRLDEGGAPSAGNSVQDSCERLYSRYLWARREIMGWISTR